MNIKVNVEIHCLKPSWVNYENNRYRLYINNSLLTERTWIWGLNTKINEHIYVNLPRNSENTIRIEPILKNRSVAKFVIRNLSIDDIIINSAESETTELTFKTYKYSKPEKTHETIRIYQRRV